MKLAAHGLPDAVRADIQSWGWEFTEDSAGADAILNGAGLAIEIRAAPTQHADEVIFLPISQEELRFRIQSARDRHARLARRLHDLRSPLNAIHGYAEMLAESVDGDALRFASNICTASDLLTARLTAIRDEGV